MSTDSSRVRIKYTIPVMYAVINKNRMQIQHISHNMLLIDAVDFIGYINNIENPILTSKVFKPEKYLYRPICELFVDYLLKTKYTDFMIIHDPNPPGYYIKG